MKISTKGRYALRMMLDLAIHDVGQAVPVKAIAARQEISEKYLEQIIAILAQAGFVVSTRGARGGYRLSRPPKDYTVGMILRLTEGSLACVACLDADAPPCHRSSHCTTLTLWKKLDHAISDIVDHTTLADLVESEQNQQSNHRAISV